MSAPINMVLTATLATLYYAVKTLVDSDVPPNAGFHRAISVFAEPGSILNAQEPAAVYSRTDISMRLVDMILAALQPAIPEKVMAACTGGGLVTISGTDPRNGRFYVYNEMIGGGMGARYGPASARGRDLVAKDIREDRISAEAAARVYAYSPAES